MSTPLTVQGANAVYDVLVDHAGAPASLDSWVRRDFIDHQTTGSTDEYRFQGSLGFGGKFWNCNSRWYVTCYPEDETPTRRAAVEATNAALNVLRHSVRS